MLIVADDAVVSPLADIEDSSRGTRIEIGSGTVIDAFVKVKPAGGEGDVVIGARTRVNSGVVIYSGHGVQIGDDVLIAANCTLSATNHEVRRRDTPINQQRFMPSRGGILIENDVWVGANSVVLDGARLRQGCVIGAGSIVRGEVEAYTIWAGNPLRRIGERS